VAAQIVPIFCPYGTSGVSAYLIAADRPILIDTGGPQHPQAEIAQALAERGWTLADVDLIVNTHGHWDHASGNAAVAETAGDRLAVWIHELGAPLLTEPARHLDGYYGDTARRLGRDDILQNLDGELAAQFEVSPPASRVFADGERLEPAPGVTLDVFHVPGHSEDHCALLWAEAGVLIAGDAAQGTGSRVGGCPAYFQSIAAARASIHRLLEIPFRELHVSHRFGRPGKSERTQLYDLAGGRAFLQGSLDVLDWVEEALAEAHREAPAAPFVDQLTGAVRHLEQAGHWELGNDPETGYPWGAPVTFHRMGEHLGYW
jgi:glyoxylase-like metal-dependent hydrolase (beta-lactamase superfamily II)